MICLIALIVMAVMISERNEKIRTLEGRPKESSGCLWLVLVVAIMLVMVAASA